MSLRIFLKIGNIPCQVVRKIKCVYIYKVLAYRFFMNDYCDLQSGLYMYMYTYTSLFTLDYQIFIFFIKFLNNFSVVLNSATGFPFWGPTLGIE